MSYTGSSVYFPPTMSLGSLVEALSAAMPKSKVTALDAQIDVATEKGVVSVVVDRAPHVSLEARELAELQQTPQQASLALRECTWRVEIVPASPRTDPDDVYNELLGVFEALCEHPGAVGHDPFDGAFHVGRLG